MIAPDVLIVGAGFAGATCARILADAGWRIVICDQRDHIGGNAFDCHDTAGVLIHPYGPHILHTENKHVQIFLSRFTDWRPYEHVVQARLRDGCLLPYPLNAETVFHLYGRHLDERGMRAFYAQQSTPIVNPQNLRDVLLSQIGEDLYELFFRGYTYKQWGCEPQDLDSSMGRRIPVRYNADNRYFTDCFQQMPANGYQSLFKHMLDHEHIELRLQTPCTAADVDHATQVIWTGPLDAFFEYCYGPLPYRSLRFEHEHLPDTVRYQPVATVNEVDRSVPYTRTTEFKHITGQQHTGTSIVREYAQDTGDPYYPVPRTEPQILADQYRKLAAQQSKVSFVGRLAEYRYYNMDQVVAAALRVSKRLITAKEWVC